MMSRAGRGSGFLTVAATLVAAAVSLATVGCGGGMPLLHPARTMQAGDVRAMGGISANIVPGSLGDDLRRARQIATEDPNAPGPPGSNPDFAKGALVAAALAPGLAPVAGARVGVGNRFEAGLAYTGRSVRADMRRSFDEGPWSLSLGLGASAALYGRQQGSDLPNVDIQALRGYGADLPVLVGWESVGGLYMLWVGARTGFERNTVEAVTSEPKDVTIGTPPIRLEATRFHAGGLVGFATGFRHVHVAIELGAAYQIVNGSYNDNNVAVRGITLVPSSALWWSF